MKEITKKELEGFWIIKPLMNCDFNDIISFYFRDNQITINGTEIKAVEYKITDNEGLTKLLKNNEDITLLEIWMIMDYDINSLIVKIDDKKYYIEKR
ncbi:MAG: hypothetical protein H6Q15_2406 [Bacteroidetes bacterium]|nr:hypothetical protein [Bacteroidota bacterium]